MLNPSDVALICQGAHGDPFAVLGPHDMGHGCTSVRAFIPGADQVQVLATLSQQVLGSLVRRHDDGFFEQVLTSAPNVPYQLQSRVKTPSV